MSIHCTSCGSVDYHLVEKMNGKHAIVARDAAMTIPLMSSAGNIRMLVFLGFVIISQRGEFAEYSGNYRSE